MSEASSQNFSESCEHTEEDEKEIPDIVLFTFISILLIIVSYELKKHFKVPVSPILLLIGTLFRVIGGAIAHIDSSVSRIDSLNPELVTLCILPALIFEAAFSSDWYTFKREIWQILPLATTVVILSAVLTAVVVNVFLDYQFLWYDAFLLGVILSATDHVAVVAQLKEMHVDNRFKTLIEGETLLNEATVLVFFNIMLDHALGSTNVAGSIAQFVNLTCTGFVLGISFAIAMGWAIKRMVNDSIQETLLTFAAAYLLFYTSNEINSSGAISVVTLGLYMSAYGKTLISPIAEKSLHNFWNIVGTSVESVVFIIAGMLLGMFFVKESSLELKDVVRMGTLFIFLHLVRGVVLLIHYPVLKFFGYGITIKEVIVMTLSGLKGAIATSLALIVFHEDELDSHFRVVLLFFTIGISGLSIIFDSLAMKFAVKKFGMETLSEVEENMLVGVTTAILQHTAKKVEKMRSDKQFNLVKWDKVMKLAGPKNLLVQIMKNTNVGANILRKHQGDSPEELLSRYTSKFSLSLNALIKETRRRYFTTLKGIYWQEFNSGQCSGYASLILIESCNRALDKEDSKMSDWEHLEKELYNKRLMSIYNYFSGLPLIGKIFKNLLYDIVILTYDAASTFISAHHEAEELMDNMEIDIDEAIFHKVMEEAHDQIELCKEFVRDNITDSYPEVVAEVTSSMACYALLISQRKLINKIFHQGVIKEIEYEHLIDAIDNNMKQLTFQQNPSIPSIKEILKNRFRNATDKDIEQLLPMITEKHYQPGQFLFKEGEPADGAYLIINGRVHELAAWIDQELMIGNIVGVQHLLPIYQVNMSTAKAITMVFAAHIPAAMLNKDIYIEDLYKEASEELISLNAETLGFEGVEEEHLMRMIKSSKIRYFLPGDLIDLRRGGIVLLGSLRRDKPEFSILSPVSKPVEAITSCVLLLFPEFFSESIRESKTMPEAFANYYLRSNAKAQIIRNNDETNNSLEFAASNNLHRVEVQRLLSRRSFKNENED
ncbi:unnamed protein product [Blepharisma stoltei]|uniref:Cyclic nucleotide-binding domain-containing protein n=1 Tax=Blepharisma stoltei TaxID=1481888 RepID=A0AAU9INW8_9CILI|nr:unnamed protein product [Blepharisma stoltei]